MGIDHSLLSYFKYNLKQANNQVSQSVEKSPCLGGFLSLEMPSPKNNVDVEVPHTVTYS